MADRSDPDFTRSMEWRDSITVDPAVLTGKPIVKGTRIAVEFVLDLLAQGWPEAEIAHQYRLEVGQVRACVAYAQARLRDEKVFTVAA